MSEIKQDHNKQSEDNRDYTELSDTNNISNDVSNDISTDVSSINLQNIGNIKKKKIKWTDKHVDILVDWADKAMCYRWLHSRNTDRYKSLNTWFTIPVIIMSTLTGTANFAQEQVPQELRGYYSMIVGSVNILAGIITTVQNFLKISQLNEAHRVAAIAWDKFYRKIKLELAKSPEERINVELFLKNCSEEFDRLIETSPDIDRKILKKFKETFEGKKNISQKIKDMINSKLLILIDDNGASLTVTEKQKAFKLINKPVIYDHLETIRNTVYQSTLNQSELITSTHPFTSEIPNPPEKLVSEQASNDITEIVKRRKLLEDKEKKINEFCSQFKEKYFREPTEDEIIENLENEQEKLTKAIITNYIYKFKEKRKKIIEPSQNNNIIIEQSQNNNVIIDIKDN